MSTTNTQDQTPTTLLDRRAVCREKKIEVADQYFDDAVIVTAKPPRTLDDHMNEAYWWTQVYCAPNTAALEKFCGLILQQQKLRK